MKSLDPILALLILALALTLVLFFLDIFPYPFGLLILSAFVIGRVLSIQGFRKKIE